MEILNDPLPAEIVDAARNAKGNFATKNAQYRQAVCNYLGLQWQPIGGKGNCFFDSVATTLLATLPPNRLESMPDLKCEGALRTALVDWLRLQTEVRDDLAERVQVEIDAELNQGLICSRRGVSRVVPSTREEYLSAVAVDGVWIQGYHWLRAVSTIALVRVGVVIFEFDSVVYFGQGDATIYLYKVRSFLRVLIIHLIHHPD